MGSEVFDMKKYNKFKKAYASGGNMKKILGPKTTVNTNDISILNKIQNLENKVNEQSEKLNKIVKLLDDLSKEKSITWSNSRI